MLGTEVPGPQGNFWNIQAGVTHVHTLTHLCTDSFHKHRVPTRLPNGGSQSREPGRSGSVAGNSHVRRHVDSLMSAGMSPLKGPSDEQQQVFKLGKLDAHQLPHAAALTAASPEGGGQGQALLAD